MPGVKRDFYNVCPDCWSVRIKHRVFKNPRYKCEKCGCEFMNKKRISHDDRILFNELKRKASNNVKQNFGIGVEDTYIRKITVKGMKEYLARLNISSVQSQES